MFPVPHRARRSRFGWIACAPLLALGACRSADAWAQQADDEVYEILAAERAEFEPTEPFDVLRPTRLRARILRGEVARAEVLELSLAQCIEIAEDESRQLQDQREGLYLVALGLTRQRWELAVQEFGSFGALLSEGPGDGDNAGVLSFGPLASLTRLLTIGGLFVVDLALDVGRDFARGDGFDAVSNLTVRLIDQPLLRGFGRHIVREPLTQAERDVVYQVQVYERFRRTFAVDVAARFYRILQQVDTLDNEVQNEIRLRDLRQRNEAFSEAGRLSDIQVDQARQNELSARNSVVDARRRLQASLDDFKFFLGLPIDARIALDGGAGVEELVELVDVEENIVEDDAVFLALDQRLDHQVLVGQVVDQQRKVRVDADALRAGLDIDASFTAGSEDGRPLNFSDDGTSWSLGIDFDLPLQRLPERNAYRRRLISLQVALRTVEASQDGIRIGLRDAHRDLIAARQSYEIQSGAVELAQRRVESAQLNLEAGRASTRDLLEAQRDLVTARNAAIRTLTDYALAGLTYYRDMELLRLGPDGLNIDRELLAGLLPEGKP